LRGVAIYHPDRHRLIRRPSPFLIGSIHQHWNGILIISSASSYRRNTKVARAASCITGFICVLASIASASTCHVGIHILLNNPGLDFFFSLTTAALLDEPLLRKKKFWWPFCFSFLTTLHVGAVGEHPFIISSSQEFPYLARCIGARNYPVCFCSSLFFRAASFDDGTGLYHCSDTISGV
jgi:hypothetical protein